MLNTLYIFNETQTNGYNVEILDIVSFVSILSAILVITIKNPISSVLSLIVLFFSIASYLMFLGFNFIGLAYLLVYVGAVSILFLFILMLINVKISELLSNTSNSIPLAILTVIIFNIIISGVTPENMTNSASIINSMNEYISDIFNNVCSHNSTSFSWDGNLSETSHITSIGNIMYTSYSIWLILTSIILLLAMVGAIVITIKQKD